MAGDWIKMRVDLSADPAVVRMAAVLGLDRFAVVGRLHAVWGWADAHADTRGRVTLVSHEWVDSLAQTPGFARAMESVGWLAVDDAGVTFPRFDRHMGGSAKVRTLATERKRKSRRERASSDKPQRDKASDKEWDGGHADVTLVSQKSVTREEKRREEKKAIPPTPPSGGGAAAEPVVDLVDAAGTLVKLSPLKEFIAAWGAAKLPGHDAPGGIQQNHTRRGWFEQRQRDPRWREHWREAVARLGRSGRAKGGRKGFEQGVRLDTFLRDPAFLDQVLEGNWDDAVADSAVNRLLQAKQDLKGVLNGHN